MYYILYWIIVLYYVNVKAGISTLIIYNLEHIFVCGESAFVHYCSCLNLNLCHKSFKNIQQIRFLIIWFF